MLHRPFALAALLAASSGAQATTDTDLAAIRSQIEEMQKTYEQRITALEKKLADAEARTAGPVAVPPAAATGSAAPAPAATPAGATETGPVRAIASAANAFNPEVSLILQGQYVSRTWGGPRKKICFISNKTCYKKSRGRNTEP